MNVCKRTVEWMEIMSGEGDVRTCCWMKGNPIIGNMLKQPFEEIMNGEKATQIRSEQDRGNYYCVSDNCLYYTNGTLEEEKCKYDKFPDYPECLSLSFEGNCNYECTCCSSRQNMLDAKANDYSKNYAKLEEELHRIMPKIRRISANGRGELFCSPITMRLLSEWSPEFSDDECSVLLQTNGSLFNEVNWKKIQNLGKYHLTVAVTVMSFDDRTYQFLSGTKLPVSNIESNLRFLKELRESGEIDRLTIATVSQEANFREMPEFTRRCIEEFGADSVRLRPIFPFGGKFDAQTQWFMDVRNPLHPYYSLYREVIKDPIFKNPKVYFWSGDMDSLRGPLPDSSDVTYLRREREVLCILSNMINDEENLRHRIKEIMDGKEIAVYGMGTIGKCFINSFGDILDLKLIFDRKCQGYYRGIPIKSVISAGDFDGTVVITPYGKEGEMMHELDEAGFHGTVVVLPKLLQMKG